MNFTPNPLQVALIASRISLSSPRAHTAAGKVAEGMSIDEAVKVAVIHETAARNMWTEQVLDPWCKRHGITREQGLSINFDDSEFDPQNPSKPLPTKQALFAWGGQQNDFAQHLMWVSRQKQQDQPQDLQQEPRKELRSFTMICCFPYFEIGRHMTQATESISRIPKFWVVSAEEREWIKAMFLNPRCTGQFISFKHQSECTVEEFARYSDLLDDLSLKCHQKKFLFDNLDASSPDRIITAFCSLAKGGASDNVRTQLAEFMPAGWNVPGAAGGSPADDDEDTKSAVEVQSS